MLMIKIDSCNFWRSNFLTKLCYNLALLGIQPQTYAKVKKNIDHTRK